MKFTTFLVASVAILGVVAGIDQPSVKTSAEALKKIQASALPDGVTLTGMTENIDPPASATAVAAKKSDDKEDKDDKDDKDDNKKDDEKKQDKLRPREESGKSKCEDNDNSLRFCGYDLETEEKDKKVQTLRLEWRTKYACADAPSPDGGSHWGFFGWFFIMCVTLSEAQMYDRALTYV